MALRNEGYARKGSITDIEKGRTEKQAELIELRAKGKSYRDIAKELRIAKSTVASWCQELEGEIASAKAMELEALYKKYHLQHEGRIKLLGEFVGRMRKELLSRDLSEVPTKKLYDLFLKYAAELKEERLDIRALSVNELSALKDGTRPKLDSNGIAREMERTLLRYRSGMIDNATASRELALLQAMLKAREQGEIEAKLERLEAVLGG